MTSLTDRVLPAGSRPGRIGALVLVLAIVAGVIVYFVSGSPTRTVKAQFREAVGMYEGSDVRMLGVKVGSITAVIPKGTSVEIDMKVDDQYKIPANAIATIIPPSLVSDRYVQLAPMYTGGPTLADNATIPLDRTATPVELDDIYSALNRLNTALGPQGANKNGALSDLISTSAANLDGNGAQLGQTLQNLSQAVSTLANGREDLFGTVRNLTVFTKALQDSDAQVRNVNTLLATVSGDLADERASLASAIKNLSTALTSVAGFLQQNQNILNQDLGGLKDVTGVLANKQAALREILSVAPVALSNLGHTYNPGAGTLDTRSNVSSLFDPAQICAALLEGNALSHTQLIGGVYQVITGATNLDGICAAVLNASPPTPTIPGLPGVGGNLPTLPSIPGLPSVPVLGSGSGTGSSGSGTSGTSSGTGTSGGSLPRIGLPTIPGLG